MPIIKTLVGNHILLYPVLSLLIEKHTIFSIKKGGCLAPTFLSSFVIVKSFFIKNECVFALVLAIYPKNNLEFFHGDGMIIYD